MLRKILSRLIALLLLLLFYACSGKTPCKVVMLYSFDEHDKGYGHTRQKIVKALEEKGFQVDFREVYLRYGHATQRMVAKTLEDSLNSLKKWNPDLILVKGDQALDEMLRSYNELTLSKPVLFHGVHFLDEVQMASRSNFSGYWDAPDFWQNLKMIPQLLGENVVIDVNYSKTELGKIRHKRLMESLRGRNVEIMQQELLPGDVQDSAYIDESVIRFSAQPEVRLNMVAIPNMTCQGLLRFINNRSSGHDKSFLISKFEYSTHIVASYYQIPIFSAVNDGFMDDMGVVGGYFANEDTEIDEISSLAAQVLNDGNMSHKIFHSQKQYNFDYNLLEQYNIDQSLLPQGSLVVNVPFYHRHKVFIWVLSGVAVLLLLFGMYYLGFVRRQAIKEVEMARLQQKSIDSILNSLEQSSVFTCDITADNVLHLASSHRSITGWDKDEFTFVELMEHVYWQDIEMLQDRLHHIFEEEPTPLEFRFMIKGESVWFSFNYSVVSVGNASMICGICENIQERKEQEQAYVNAKKVAEEAENKQSFLENLNHEIRTPLNAIVGLSDVICNDDGTLDKETKAQYVDTINKNNEALLQLISNILEISRIDSGYSKMDLQRVNMLDFLNELEGNEKGGINPRLKFFVLKEGVENIYINVDKERLAQALHHLISNANKFTKKGYIAINCWVDSFTKEIGIAVEDSGCGIEQKQLKAIFNRFYKTDDFSRGTGLGLSICDAIVSKLNGRMMVASKINKGSTFTIVLPLG